MSGPEPQGRVALITGAASGIGQSAAQLFVERGVTALALFDLDGEGLSETELLIAETTDDVEVITRVVDVSDAGQLADGFAAAIERFGRLDYVVNNAATMTLEPGYPAVSAERIGQVVDINLGSVLNGTKLAFEHMAANGGGSIVSTASGAGKVGLPSDPLYAATKAGVIVLTRSSAPSFARAGVRINAVCPSVVDTPMLASTAEGRAALAGAADGTLSGLTLLTPRDVATAIVDLATDPDRTGETPSVKG